MLKLSRAIPTVLKNEKKCPEEEVLVQTVKTKCDNLSLKHLLVGNPLHKTHRLNLSPIIFVRLKDKISKNLVFIL